MSDKFSWCFKSCQSATSALLICDCDATSLVVFFFSSFPQMVFYIQDSDDVYGIFLLNPAEEQSIQSQPEGRFLSLNLLRDGGMLGAVSLTLTALYIPAGPIDPTLARDRVLNVSRSVNVLFSHERSVHVKLPIRNDAFLQNGAHFLIQVNIGENK